MMEIILNNQKEIISQEKMTVAELIRYKNFTFRLLVTKVNGRLVKKDERETTFVADGDEVVIMHLISGG